MPRRTTPRRDILNGTLRYVFRYLVSREVLRLFRRVVMGRW